MNEEWGVYERVDSVHVIPQHDDLHHLLTQFCLCEPNMHQDEDMDLPVYIHKVVYYN